jgi:hypothetical protein
MLCHGVVHEVRGPKSCWLPAERGSQFQLCRRCHFNRVTEILDQLTRVYGEGQLHPSNELLLNDASFLNELLHPAREQALMSLLASLFRKNQIQFFHVITKLAEKSVFSILITNRIVSHSPGTRCEMYRTLLRHTSLYMGEKLCSRCWPCLAWMAKQREDRFQRLLKGGFGLVLWKLSPTLYREIGDAVFVDLCASFLVRGNSHSLYLFLAQCLSHLPFEDVLQFCTVLVKDPCFFSLVLGGSLDDVFPAPLRDKEILKSLQKSVRGSIKQKTDVYKEDLMIKTWHPSRLFSWCFDLEELADFSD